MKNKLSFMIKLYIMNSKDYLKKSYKNLNKQKINMMNYKKTLMRQQKKK